MTLRTLRIVSPNTVRASESRASSLNAMPSAAELVGTKGLTIRCGNAMVKSGKVIESAQHSQRVGSTLQTSRLNTLFESAQCPS